MMNRNRESGFTLIEVVISLMILAMLSVLTTNAVRRAIDNRQMVSTEVARDAKLADAVRIMRSDITNAYHHRDVAVTLQNEAMKPEATATPTGNAPPPADAQPPQGTGFGIPQAQQQQAGPTPRPTPVQLTGFAGDASSLYFTSLSNVRTMQDAKESNQAKIGYFVKACQVRGARGEKAQASRCLYRAITPVIDKELTTPGPETVLLENVEEFQLRYLGPGNEDYVEAWKTGEGGDQNTKENFPYAVEVTLTMQDRSEKGAKKSTANALIPLWFPNNPPKKQTAAAGDGSAPVNPNAAGAN